MKALSLRQPSVDAILSGRKTVDIRGRATRHRGDLLIHASKTYGPAERERLAFLRSRGVELPDPDPAGFGALVGIVQVVDCRRATDEDWDRALAVPEGDGEHWAWELAQPERFPVPIPYRGSIRLFDVADEELAAAVLAPA